MSPVISPREPAENKPFVSPADRLVAEQSGQYYKLSEVATVVGKSSATIRRLMRMGRVKAPSYQIRQGDMLVYLFTPEDIEEIRNYFGSQKPEKR